MKTVVFGIIYLAFAVLLLPSCEKRDPNPHLKDEIYQDLVQELDISKKRVADEEVQNKKVRLEMESVVPQSGQIKYAQKRVNESDNNLDLYRQQTKYFEIKLEQRKIYVQQRYLESLKKDGRKWPDEEEIKDYKLRLKLQRAKLDWNKKDKKPSEAKSEPMKKDSSGHGSAEPAKSEH